MIKYGLLSINYDRAPRFYLLSTQSGRIELEQALETEWRQAKLEKYTGPQREQVQTSNLSFKKVGGQKLNICVLGTMSF